MMETLTPKERDIVKAAGIVAVLLIVLVGYYYFTFVRTQIRKNEEQFAKVKAEITQLEERLTQMEIMTQNLLLLKEKQALLEQISKKLPTSVDAPGFMTSMVNILTATRVEYTELAQQALQVRNIYTEIPYAIKCKSRYHDFGQFLNLIEENPFRFMRVRTFKIENQDERPSVHPIEVGIATFMFNSKG